MSKLLPVEFTLTELKRFVIEAKRNTFAADAKKSYLIDQTSIHSYRDFSDADSTGTRLLMYQDVYNGNTAEIGEETVSINMVKVWRNQYCGGTMFFPKIHQGLHVNDWAQYVSNFLRKALSNLSEDFPVRGPKIFEATSASSQNKQILGDWKYLNSWEYLPLYLDVCDPFVSYRGLEYIYFNDEMVYWHAYQGGLIYDKYAPFFCEEIIK